MEFLIIIRLYPQNTYFKIFYIALFQNFYNSKPVTKAIKGNIERSIAGEGYGYLKGTVTTK